MSTNLNYKQVANVKRRTWDVEAYEKKAKERAAAEQQQQQQQQGGGAPSTIGRRVRHQDEEDGGEEKEKAPKRFKLDGEGGGGGEDKEEFKPAEPGAAGPQGSKRAFLQPRTNKVDIDSKIGETEIISAEAAAKTSLQNDGVVTKSGVGWHCSVCDCFLKDSMTYLDHINGRKHQRKLGYSMRVERSTKDQMMGRLSQLAKEKERAEQQSETKKFETNYQDVLKAKDEEEAQKKAERARKRKEKKKAKKAALLLDKSSPPPPPPPPPPEQRQQENEGAEEEEEEVEEEGINPDLAAMMGFSGFGGGK